MRRAELADRAQHALGDRAARFDRRTLREIEQHRGERVVLAVELDAADEVGVVFAVGEKTCRLARRTARRKHPHRRTARVARGERIRVNRHEQVGLHLARFVIAVLETDVVIAVASQHGAHAGGFVDLALEFARDHHRDVLFLRARIAFRTRIGAAVAGIDHDDDVARPCRRHPRALDDFGLALAFRIEVDDEAIALAAFGRHQETFRADVGGKIEHDAQVGLVLRPGAQRFEQALAARRGKTFGRGRIAHIEDDAIGIGDLEQLVVDRAGEVEKHARAVGFHGNFGRLQLSRGGKRRRRQQQPADDPMTQSLARDSPHGAD